jgi:hypothetical protein
MIDRPGIIKISKHARIATKVRFATTQAGDLSDDELAAYARCRLPWLEAAMQLLFVQQRELEKMRAWADEARGVMIRSYEAMTGERFPEIPSNEGMAVDDMLIALMAAEGGPE